MAFGAILLLHRRYVVHAKHDDFDTRESSRGQTQHDSNSDSEPSKASLSQVQLQASAELHLATAHTSSKVIQPDHHLMKALRSWSFTDALNFDASANMMRSLSQDALEQRILSATPEVLHMVATSIQASSKAHQLVAQFKPETWAAIQAGSLKLMTNAKTGISRGSAVNAATGRVAEQAVVSAPGNAAAAVNIINIVVTAAHLVAGWDNAKSLKRIEKSLDVIHQRYAVKL